MLDASASGQVSVSAEDTALRISAPFGELVIPYTRMIRVTDDVEGGIRIDAPKTRIWLDLAASPGRRQFLALLREKVQDER